MSKDREKQLSHWIETACLWEAVSPKVGNVHPQASFDDLTHDDFVCSASLTAAALSKVDSRGVSQVILDAVLAVQSEVGKNTNLGIILLLAPLAAAKPEEPIHKRLPEILDALSVKDSCRIYEAIQLTQPGGLLEVSEQDLSSSPTKNVREIMSLAQDHDTIAKQYANNFQDVLGFGIERLQYWWDVTEGNKNQAIVGLHLSWMANYPDTLIQRKCGEEIAQQSASYAAEILEPNDLNSPQSQKNLNTFDAWLRADRNKRNPGTSADLVAACLFVGLREGIIEK